MKRSVILMVAALSFVMGASIPQARADFSLGVTAGDGGLRSFYLAIGDYYRCPERDVYVVHERGIPDDEMPVVFFLSNYVHVPPAMIVDLRLRGWSWDRITLYFGAGPEIYYVPVPVVVTGPPYGRAYGHFRKVPREKWHKIHLSDDDVVNLVNLRFVSEHNHVSAREVMDLRSGGRPFRDVYQRAGHGGGKPDKADRGAGGGAAGHRGGGHGKHGR